MSNISYKSTNIAFSYWKDCEIYQIGRSIELKTENRDLKRFYENIQYAIKLPTVDSIMYMTPFPEENEGYYMLYYINTNNFKTCMNLDIDFLNYTLFSNYIQSEDCMHQYRYAKGLKALMLLRFDILRYLCAIDNKFETCSIKIIDTSNVPLKYSNIRKRLLIARIFNPSIPIQLLSIYNKYCDNFDTTSKLYHDLVEIVEEMRHLKFSQISELFVDCSDYHLHEASKTFCEVLFDSEELKMNNRIVDMFYKNVHNNANNVYTRNDIMIKIKKIYDIVYKLGLNMTYMSLFRIFRE